MKLYAVRWPSEPGRRVFAFVSGPDQLADLLDSEEDPGDAEYAVYRTGIAFEVRDPGSREAPLEVASYGLPATEDPLSGTGLRWRKLFPPTQAPSSPEVPRADR